jgi:GntR family transcriptional regulator, transcriptional repressor for pyruvate dehydrogenase complex
MDLPASRARASERPNDEPPLSDSSLGPLVAENRMRLNALLDQIPLLPRNIAHSDEQHEAIVVALLAADGDGAAAAMRAHVAGSAALSHGFLD